MQGYQVLVVALLASASATVPAMESNEFSCFADILGFPAAGKREADAEAVLASVRPKGDAAKASAAAPTGTMKSDTCSEDEFGEMTIGSMKEIFRLVKLTQKDSFVDLGSGLGEVPVSAAVLSGVRRATGVELNQERHQAACQGLTQLSSELDANSKNKNASMVELMQGDMLKMDLHDDTVVFTNNYCFRRHLNDKLAEKLATDLPEGARVVSTKAFGALPPRMVALSDGPLPLGEGISVSIYELRGPAPPKGEKRGKVLTSKKQLKEAAIARQHRKKARAAKQEEQADKKLSLLRKSMQGR